GAVGPDRLGDRVEAAQERVEADQERWEVVAQERAESGEAARRPLVDYRETGEEVPEIGSQAIDLPQRRGELARGRHQLADERIGLLGEGLQALDRGPRFVEEGREGAEGGLDVGVAGARDPEDAIGRVDQARELTAALAESFEGPGAIREELGDRV